MYNEPIQCRRSRSALIPGIIFQGFMKFMSYGFFFRDMSYGLVLNTISELSGGSFLGFHLSILAHPTPVFTPLFHFVYKSKITFTERAGTTAIVYRARRYEDVWFWKAYVHIIFTVYAFGSATRWSKNACAECLRQMTAL